MSQMPVPVAKGAKSSKAKRTKSAKAGLTFPVTRVHRHLKNGGYIDRVGTGAAIFMGAVLEYLSAEVLLLFDCLVAI